MASRIARAIEKALADGDFTPEQEIVMVRRMRVIERAYEMGGDEAAEHADRIFLEDEYGPSSGY
jgi:hypothetical protein